MTREEAAAIIAAPRGALPVPFERLLDVPELAVAAAALGEEIRFRAPLSPRIREFLTLATASACRSEYEWDYHVPLAMAAGLSEQELEGARGRPAPLDDDLSACRRLVDSVIAGTRTGMPDDWPLGTPAYLAAVVLIGYYRLLASVLDTTGGSG